MGCTKGLSAFSLITLRAAPCDCLLLRADIHRLFDQGFVTVTPDYQFRVSRRLRDEYENGRVYYELEERIRKAGGIHLPPKLENRPEPEILKWHSNEKFVG